MSKRIENQDQYKEMTYEAVENFNKDQFQEALQKFQTMAEANPTNAKVHEVLCFIYLKLEDIEKAEEEFKICCDLMEKQHPGLVLKKDKTFEQQVREAGDPKTLQKDYDKIITSKEKVDLFHDMETVAKLSVVYMASGKFKKAEKLLLEFKEKLLKDHVSPISME